jgi:hypothetical protein
VSEHLLCVEADCIFAMCRPTAEGDNAGEKASASKDGDEGEGEDEGVQPYPPVSFYPVLGLTPLVFR